MIICEWVRVTGGCVVVTDWWVMVTGFDEGKESVDNENPWVDDGKQ